MGTSRRLVITKSKKVSKKESSRITYHYILYFGSKYKPMVKSINLLKYVTGTILIYWILVKFLAIHQNTFLNILYEMSSVAFLLATLVMPVVIIALLISTYIKKELNKQKSILLSLYFVISIVNLSVMIWG